MAKIHCHSLLSGSSWDSFDEDSPEDEPEAMEVDENNTFCTNEATRLWPEDMPLFGLCPAQEQVCLVICNECGRVVKASAFPRHSALMHAKEPPPPSLSPPETMEASPTVESLLQSGSKASPGDTAIKIEKVELNDSNVKIEEVPLELNHALPASVKKSHPVVPNAAMKKSLSEKSNSNKKSPRKVIPTREREFDADKHCGVWVADQQKKCTRSLTCKTHALSLRRAVLGRKKTFDALLAEHKARVNSEKEQHNQAALKLQELKAAADNNFIKPAVTATTHAATLVNNVSTERLPAPRRSISIEDDSSDNAAKPSGEPDSDGIEESLSYSGITTLNHHPKPMVTIPFGGRKVGQGAVVFNRRQDHLRCAVLAMVEKCLNPSQQRHSSGRPGAATILHRPTVKTIGQSSNHGISKGTSSYGDKYKSHGVLSSTNKNLNNFLKAPPPPRNRSAKQNAASHGSHSNSVENSTVYQTLALHNGKKTFIDSSSSHLSSTGSDTAGFLKPDVSTQAISDMGSIVASIDANVAGGQALNIGNQISRTPTSSFQTVVNVSLDSSLNLCSAMGLNSEASTTGTRTSYTSVSTPFVTTISGNHINTLNSAPGGVGNVKEILPSPRGKGAVTSGVGVAVSSSMANKVVQLAGQLDPNTGKATSTSAGQRASPLFFTKQNAGTVQVSNCLPNGTGPSLPPNVTSMKGYPVSFVIQNNAGGKVGATVATVANPSFGKGHSLVFNSMGVAQMQQQSHIITQQPPSPMQQHQKGKVAIRANSFQKGTSKSSNTQIKIPQSPSPQQPSPGQLSPGQPAPQKTIVVTSPQPGQQNLYLNHQHLPSTSPHAQPIVQLKQQVEQQQQQLQQITLQQQLQQQQLQQQQLQQQKQLNSQFVKQQLPIQPRLAPAPPHPSPQQTFITQQQLSGQNIVIKNAEQPLKSPPNSVFVTTDSHIQATVVHKPQSNVA